MRGSRTAIGSLAAAVTLVGAAQACGGAAGLAGGSEPAAPRGDDVTGPWMTLAGRPGPAPSLPCVLVAAGGNAYLIHGDHISEYVPGEDAWLEDDVRLPGAVGPGVAATVDHAGALLVFRGGRTRDFWRFDPRTRQLETLPPTPEPVGRGGALDQDGAIDGPGPVYALRGDRTGDFWRYEPSRGAWTVLSDAAHNLPRVGNFTGAIMCTGGEVYAWADHHVKRYDMQAGLWKNFMSFGFRPCWDGAMYAQDERNDAWVVLLGKASYTLALFAPQHYAWGFLRPRLPVGVSGEGSRAVVVDVGGEAQLLVYDVAGGNRMYRIPMAELELISKESPRSEPGSPWRSVHERWGASLVRDNTDGLLGPAGERWYFVRFKGVRFVDPVTGEWSGYPGVGVVDRLGPGLCATWDGERRVYAFPGGGARFVCVDAEASTGEQLPSPPVDVGAGAQMVFWRGRVHALMGGGTRRHLAFDPRAGTWSEAPPLPGDATPVGEAGSGLVVSTGDLVAVSGEQAWRLDEGARWSRCAQLPHGVSPDGGMVAADPAGSKIYLVEGGGSRRLSVVDLEDPDFANEVRLPDVVSVRGRRAFVYELQGEAVLALMRGHDTNEIFLIDLDELNRPHGQR